MLVILKKKFGARMKTVTPPNIIDRMHDVVKKKKEKILP